MVCTACSLHGTVYWESVLIGWLAALVLFKLCLPTDPCPSCHNITLPQFKHEHLWVDLPPNACNHIANQPDGSQFCLCGSWANRSERWLSQRASMGASCDIRFSSYYHLYPCGVCNHVTGYPPCYGSCRKTEIFGRCCSKGEEIALVTVAANDCDIDAYGHSDHSNDMFA